jgi:hypothetical protein
MGKEKTLGELADVMGKADILRLRIVESKSQVGNMEFRLKENEKAIRNAEALKAKNKEILADIDKAYSQIGEDEGKLNEMFEILRNNGVPMPDRLKGTTIVNV